MTAMRKILIMAAAAAFFMPAAEAHTARCYPAARLFDTLRAQFGERPVGAGVAASGAFQLQMWASPVGTWTLVYLRPDKAACVVADGDGWTLAPAAPAAGEAS
ncbi:MAG: hypothetical protein GY791_08375 [Alphaproteobacteria bacterium]|nr:hypothetical protein [Alphaproteobacteria bacterium]